jgi:hypothetical protein
MFPIRKKNGLATIVGMQGPLGQETAMAPEKQMDEDKAPLHAAAQDILNAIEHKSGHELASALSAFLQLDDEDSGSEEGEESADEKE